MQDCAGIWGGEALEDNCGVCDNDPLNDCVQDCAGTWGGDAFLDNCGVCDNNPNNDCVQDCTGVWGGDAQIDDCGICNGDNSSCADCAGIPNGDATEDQCGVCDNDSSNDCIFGCTDESASNYNDNATIDDGSCMYISPEEFSFNISVNLAYYFLGEVLIDGEQLSDNDWIGVFLSLIHISEPTRPY